MENLIRRFAPPSPAGKAWVVAAGERAAATIWTTSHESFARAFSKARGDLGQRPESRPQARNSKNAVFGSFCGNFAKKNGNGFLT